MIRKMEYGDSDYIVRLFTREFGKVGAIAKNAKKSARRFGGRLEPFVHIRASFKDNPRDLYFLQDVESIRSYGRFSEDFELFMWGSFLLETIDVLLEDGLVNNELYELLEKTIGLLNDSLAPIPAVLLFQLTALSMSGIGPNLESCADCGRPIEAESLFNISKGGAVCLECAEVKKNSFLVSKEFLSNPAMIEIQLGKAIQYIRLFTKFTEYHTGKKLKSSQFIEEFRL